MLSKRFEIWMAGGLCLAFFSVITWMTFRQYAVFHLQAPDIDIFVNSMWQTLRGNFLYTSILGFSPLAFHFTPIFAVLSPALLLWEDPRIFFIIQTAGLTATGLVFWAIARKELPKGALLILAVYFLNPALHEVATNEFRRITLATPFIAFAIYGLYARKTWMLLTGLLIALLCKEDVGIIIFSVGLFVVFIQRDWKLGSFLAVFGLTSFIFLTFCAIPSLHPDQSRFGCYPEAYPQLTYFGGVGSDAVPSGQQTGQDEVQDGDNENASVIRFVIGILSSPGQVIRTILDASGRAAIFRILLPFALLLPLIGWEWFLIVVPSAALMMLSSTFQLHTLQEWYMAPLIPFLMMATIVGLKRLPDKWRPWGMGSLLVCVLIGYAWTSYLPGGRLFLPTRYTLTDHHAIANEILDLVPDDAAVIAQDAFALPLVMREELYHLHFNGWDDLSAYDYLVLDRNLKHYPYDVETINNIIDERIADPQLTIAAEGDGMFLFKTNSDPHPAQPFNITADSGMLLEKAELAVTDERGIFEPTSAAGLGQVAPGDTLRVTLYWQAVAPIAENRTVSARLTAPDGWLIVQHDAVPSNGRRPTPAWEPGWYFRDVYYLTIPEGAASGDATLSILLYDSSTLENVPFEGDQSELLLANITINQ